jgi:hypothetical protein
MLLSGFEKQTYLIEVLDNIDMMFWIKSKSNNLLYVNKNALRKIFGVDDPQDIYKKECPLSCKFSESITKKEDVIEKIEVDGESMWLNCKRIPIRDDGVLVIAEDITEQYIKEQKVRNILDNKIENWKVKHKKEVKESENTISSMMETIQNIKIRNNK